MRKNQNNHVIAEVVHSESKNNEFLKITNFLNEILKIVKTV